MTSTSLSLRTQCTNYVCPNYGNGFSPVYTIEAYPKHFNLIKL